MIEIRPLEPRHIESAKQVMCEVLQDVVVPHLSVEAIRQNLDESGELSDIEEAPAHYFARRGLFLVLLDGERVVGMGGVRQLDEATCELKRMWFLRPYRGRGLGRRLAEELIAFARARGYKTMRLDSGGGDEQAAAIALYRKLGFVEIPAYNENFYARIWMEKTL